MFQFRDNDVKSFLTFNYKKNGGERKKKNVFLIDEHETIQFY